ncbi:PIN domain-containing protein [Luteolibacter sp. LG18]|uniref:PIN domain-containing protein n=1 Tax=Luteolibacter sp. LG18 TaxID=2819286 RepID=UPI0030C676A2
MLLDTNTIVRFVTGEPEKQAAEVAGLVVLAGEGKIRLTILPMVLAESVFVLNGFYKHSRAAVAEALSHLIASPGFQSPELDRLQHALKLFGVGKLDFVDCYLAAASILEKVPVVSFDRDFDKLHGVVRKAPGSFEA